MNNSDANFDARELRRCLRYHVFHAVPLAAMVILFQEVYNIEADS